MATNLTLQLSDSEGLMKVVVFTGLSHAMVMHPAVHGEPVLTAQAFYYLEQLESVAEIRFESGRGEMTETAIEYLVDNYLFEYSKRHPEAKISFKVSRGKFWHDERLIGLSTERHSVPGTGWSRRLPVPFSVF